MNKNTSRILVHTVCGLLTAAFAVFALFALSQKSLVLIVLALILLAVTAGTWIAAARSSKQGTQKEPGDIPTLDNILPKAFKPQVNEACRQRQRLQEKEALADEVFHKAFANSTISYDRYMSGIRAAAKAVDANFQQIAARIYLFDQDGYKQALAANRDFPVYGQSLAFIQEKLADNEQLLKKIDEVTVEASQIGQGQNSQSAAAHLDELIETTAFYKEKEQ